MNTFRTKRIKDYLDENKLTESEFCQKNNIEIEEFKKVINDDTSVNFQTIQKIAKGMGLNSRNILYDDNFLRHLYFD